MATYRFTSTDGTRYPCIYPEGRDPLAVPWQPGQSATHPRWHDGQFWQKVHLRISWDEKIKEVRQGRAQEARKND